MTDLLQEFAEVARTLKSVMSEGQGFALLMRLADGQYHYASIALREDVRKVFIEWIARYEARVNMRDPSESPERARVRTHLEAKCVELGHLLEAEGHRVLLFLFDFGDHGNLAWYSNAPDPRGVVQAFLNATGET
jgi:hypothetical protein